MKILFLKVIKSNNFLNNIIVNEFNFNNFNIKMLRFLS